MKNLKQQLIRLGYQDPSLRGHLRPVLDVVTDRSKQAGYLKDQVMQDLKGLFGSVDVINESGAIVVLEVSHRSGIGAEVIINEQRNTVKMDDARGQVVLMEEATDWDWMFSNIKHAFQLAIKDDHPGVMFEHILLA